MLSSNFISNSIICVSSVEIASIIFDLLICQTYVAMGFLDIELCVELYLDRSGWDNYIKDQNIGLVQMSHPR